jgi:hypothetical protein
VPRYSQAKATISGLQQELIKIGTDVRHLSHELHPAVLQEAGLPAYCEEFSKILGLPVSCETDESVEELSPGAALCLYRIAQDLFYAFSVMPTRRKNCGPLVKLQCIQKRASGRLMRKRHSATPHFSPADYCTNAALLRLGRFALNEGRDFTGVIRKEL